MNRSAFIGFIVLLLNKTTYFRRCDILTDSEPPLCQHCKQYGFECTYFLPITETRFKKKRMEEEAAAQAAVQATLGGGSNNSASSTGNTRGGPTGRGSISEKDRERSEAASSPRTSEQPRGEVKVFGALLLHKTIFFTGIFDA